MRLQFAHTLTNTSHSLSLGYDHTVDAGVHCNGIRICISLRASDAELLMLGRVTWLKSCFWKLDEAVMCLGDPRDLEKLKHSTAPLNCFSDTLGTRGYVSCASVSSRLISRWKAPNTFQISTHSLCNFLTCYSIRWEAMEVYTCNQICESWKLTKAMHLQSLKFYYYFPVFKKKERKTDFSVSQT